MMTCYTEKETLFLLDCVDFVMDNDTEYQEYSIIDNDIVLTDLRDKVYNQLMQLQEEE